MRFYLTKFFIAELEILKAFTEYLSDIDIRGLYDRVTVNVTNDHPFAQLTNGLISGRVNTAGLFPAVVITTEEETASAKIPIGRETDAQIVKCESVEGLESYAVTPKVLQDIENAILEKGVIYGGRYIFRRKDNISVEIWADNIQIKNELYDIVKTFILNYQKTALKDFLETNGAAVFAETVRGDRSNNYNFDFGITLAGARVSFELEYFNECIVLDSEVRETDIGIIADNYADGREGFVKETVIGNPSMLGG